MSGAQNAAVIAEEPAEPGKPHVTYRLAGDRALPVEYGVMEFGLGLSFFVLAADAALRAQGLSGLVETAPGFRSILVVYEPLELELVAHLSAVRERSIRARGCRS
ncbi:MAG: carboxyltransferase domain-containing protein [Actinomycetia bacterium]|nr:carboxyltransferase domain-containing protein [Actinomycetes bacterium]